MLTDATSPNESSSDDQTEPSKKYFGSFLLIPNDKLPRNVLLIGYKDKEQTLIVHKPDAKLGHNG